MFIWRSSYRSAEVYALCACEHGGAWEHNTRLASCGTLAEVDLLRWCCSGRNVKKHAERLVGWLVGWLSDLIRRTVNSLAVGVFLWLTFSAFLFSSFQVNPLKAFPFRHVFLTLISFRPTSRFHFLAASAFLRRNWAINDCL